MNDVVVQDAAILNITRACEQAIDLANHLIRAEKLGMVGFRNTVIHEYQAVDMHIVETVIKSGLDDLLAFAQVCLGRYSRKSP
jgi:uncharacterized protein YutE (UPF0331/DUF86 family)